MAEVTSDDMQKAYRRWKEVWPKSLCNWSEFCGEKHLPAAIRKGQLGLVWLVEDKCAARIKLINESPHYKAILKAMAINYETSMEAS